MKLQNLLLFTAAVFLLTVIAAAQDEAHEEAATEAAAGGILGKELAAAVAVAFAAIGAGYAVGSAGAASIGAILEKPEVFGRAMIFVAFGEALAIYGLLVALMILFNIGA